MDGITEQPGRMESASKQEGGLTGEEIKRLVGLMGKPEEFAEERDRLRMKYSGEVEKSSEASEAQVPENKVGEPVRRIEMPAADETRPSFSTTEMEEIKRQVEGRPTVGIGEEEEDIWGHRWEKVKKEEPGLSDKEKEWVGKIMSTMLLAKTPKGLVLNDQEVGVGSDQTPYGDERLDRPTGWWGDLATKARGDRIEDFYKDGYLVQPVRAIKIEGTRINEEVVKIAFAVKAEGIDDERATVDKEGKMYFPAYINLMVGKNEAEGLIEDMKAGRVKAENLIGHFYPGIKDRVLIRQRVHVFPQLQPR